MSPRILFVEDDLELAGLIGEFLTRNGFVLHHIDRGDLVEAAIAEHDQDLLLLDIMLPGKDGLSICRDLRPGFTRPIILLTSVGSDMNQVLGLELGANDYVIKTTPPAVLLARIRAQLRSAEQSEGAVFHLGAYEFRPSAKMLVDANQKKIRLTEKETNILKYLYRAGEKPVSREELLAEVWGYNAGVTTHTLETHIYRLRQKIEPEPGQARLLLTDAGGYRLQP